MVRPIALAIGVSAAVVLITALCFFIDFYCLSGQMPGYKILAYPGIAWLRLFSEEINFWPKLGLLLLGQFLAYALLALVAIVGVRSFRRSCR
ncbi:hypothetical protein [Simiduia aestuariiviva]|uniref:Uncharacterized protein n=1 Tax=Simiduia aestuariiviva TaxID=1510459 RepID=A0A839UUB7_9GAMM|nr:hypothetical protein [Simiduia aestuariiviva]MBB3169566.1 hypothetical protein [Simiduia aestuariiviva]